MKEITLLGYGHTICDANWGMQAESADFCRVYYVLAGTCRYEDSNHSFVLKRGHLYFLPQYSAYHLSQDLSDPFFVLWQHVQISGFCARQITKTAIEENCAVRYILHALEEMTRGVLIEKIATEPQKLQEQIATLLAVLVSIIEQNDTQIFFSLDRHLAKVWDYVNLSNIGTISIRNLAQIVNLERSYFSRLFHEQLGISPQQWLLRTRMAHAARMLLEGKTICETAEMIGYADEKSFSRAFMKAMQKPPAAYRKSHIMQP